MRTLPAWLGPRAALHCDPRGPPHTGPMDSLPAQLTSFVGRASAIEIASQRLREHRLVSVVGPGGCGKTRLAIEVVPQAMGPRDCVAFVDFSGLSDPALVPGTVTRAVGLREVPGQDPLETVGAVVQAGNYCSSSITVNAS